MQVFHVIFLLGLVDLDCLGNFRRLHLVQWLLQQIVGFLIVSRSFVVFNYVEDIFHLFVLMLGGGTILHLIVKHEVTIYFLLILKCLNLN